MSARAKPHPGRRLLDLAGYTLLLLSVAAVPLAFRVGIDNRLERWLEPEGDAARQYERFRSFFGSDEFVLVAYAGREILDEPGLDAQGAALERIEGIAGVLRVWGVPAVYRDFFGAEDLDAFREDMLATPFFQDFVISADGSVAGIFIEAAPAAGPLGRRELVHAIETAVEPLRQYGYGVHLAGSPALNAVLDETSERESARIFPIAAVCAALVLALQFRSVRATVVCGACAGLSLVLTLGAMGLSGRSMNMVTSVLPALLWVLALANVVHILRRYQHHRPECTTSGAAMERALRETALPCTIAAVTTACGFGALLTADMEPVRELGVFAALGMMVSLAVSLGVAPLLARWLRVPAHSPRTRVGGWTDALAGLASRRSGMVLIAGGVLGTASLIAVCWVRTEADPLTFLPADSPAVRDYRFVGERLTGFYTIEMLVDAPDGWLDRGVWGALDGAARQLEAVPGVARVLSPVDLLKKLNQWDHAPDSGYYRLPEDESAAGQLLAGLDDAGRAQLARFVTSEGRAVRLSVLVRVMASPQFLEILRAAERAMDALPRPLTGCVTGMVPRLVHAQLNLVLMQLRSFSLAFVVVFLCILAGLRSWRLTLLAIPPNLLPVLAAFAIMAAAGIALDAATVMMASVAVGIAVDNTAHLVTAYRQDRRAGAGKEAALRTTLRHVAPAMVIATVTSCCGFFALCASTFVPIQYFGLLAGAAMIAALAADLVMTPALIFRYGDKAT